MAPSSSPSLSSPNSDRWSVDIPRGGEPPAPDESAASSTGSPDKPGSTLYGDCVSVLVTCPEHLKLALALLPGTSKSLWFPIVPVKSGGSLTESVELLIQSHFPDVFTSSQATPQLIEEVRFQIAPAHAYVTVALFQCEPKPCICTHKSTPLVWLSYEDVSKCLNLAGPEIIKYAVRLMSGEQFEYDICEHSTKWTLLWALDHSEPTSEPVRVCFQNLIDAPPPSSSNLETGISCLSAHFARHCFPSLYMCYESFQEFIITSGLVLAPSLAELPAIFKAFDQEESGYLNFKQLLTGLAVMDPKVEHHQNKRLRAEYLFRYYDSQQRALVGAPKKKTDVIQQNPPKEESTTKFTELYRALSCNSNSSNTKPIPKQAFIEALESGVIKSADGLLRSSTSSIEQLLKTYSPIKPIEKKIHHELYQLCTNVLEISPETGRDVGQFPILYDIEQTSSPSSNIEKPLPNLGEIILKKIQYFFLNPNKQPISGYLGYYPENMHEMIEDVKRLCTQAEECFSAGPRILRLDSPCYVIGDLHGNAHSMACLEKIFWRMGPRMLTDNFLLLGNYVNRGPWSLECMIYLLALKLAAPKRVHLLRGNHETAHMTQDTSQDGLLDECVQKYGEEDGQVIWQSLCNVFKVMPLAAVLDNKIFCVHGGIPGPTVLTLGAIEAAIPPVLTLDPQDSISIPKQLLWNDPVPATEGSQESTATDSTTGFRANSVRKTGHYFTEQAFERFLALNNLSHVIRSHQVCLAGFKCDFGSRLITVFGSVNYADTVGNKAALALVKPEGKIQIIQFVYFNL